MDCTEATAKTSVYLPRNPHSSPLYQCVRKHYEELVGSGVVLRRIEEQVLNRFIDCGDLHKGFARIYCDDCGHDYLLAFSCKTRYFCPSCHQKRMLAYGDWVDEEVLLPVPHRQYVFSRGDRRGSELSRIAKENETDAAGRLNTDPDNTDSEYIKDARSVWTR
ncbi:MAG: hypothetical protein GY934_01005, partial [Gammaproteobacteria bacterium]|nr:hypothetical protein [Gammaproteobacteria bacterium]